QRLTAHVKEVTPGREARAGTHDQVDGQSGVRRDRVAAQVLELQGDNSRRLARGERLRGRREGQLEVDGHVENDGTAQPGGAQRLQAGLGVRVLEAGGTGPRGEGDAAAGQRVAGRVKERARGGGAAQVERHAAGARRGYVAEDVLQFQNDGV